MIFTSQLQRLFDDVGRIFDDASWGSARFSSNFFGNDEELVLQIELPGLDSADIELEIEDQVLSISAAYPSSDEDRAYLKGEQRSQSFSQQFRLPVGLDEESVHAELKDGILSIRFKRNKPQRKNITVKIK